jgi:hypothetical protein
MGSRPETPLERREREALEADLATSPMRGTPLPSRPRNFRPDPGSTVRALDGPTIWMRRLREIEDEIDRHERRLGEAWRALAEEVVDPAEFAAVWKELASSWRFSRVNELIERHNANFPVEARLAMDPRTRDFVRVNGRSYEREPLDERWILDRFPPERNAALLPR